MTNHLIDHCDMSATIKIDLNEKLYLRDPEQTELGRKIITESIRMIDETGFEHFNFKKLAATIDSTEASVYRYFENKHKLLIYLVSWYWVWLDYQISFQTNNLKDATERLRIVIRIIAQDRPGTTNMTHIDEEALSRIVVADASKAYLTKEVDDDNRDGLFREYKALCSKIAHLILEINPTYPFPKALVSSLFEISRKQHFFARHLPSLTEAQSGTAEAIGVTRFLEHLAFSAILGSQAAPVFGPNS
jgi:AcrR family transcriptional regulator